ncbi:MAG: hypothetical protein GXP33_02860, partial [Spirochaetes bacterium]|nr:hypothetical protein [Spirochaetota bacterium]
MKRHIVFLLAAVVLGFAGLNGRILWADGLFTFERSTGSAAKVDIYAGRRAEKPVSRYLYGKFAEHIGRDIYGGMWAQVLDNPGFEGWKYFLGLGKNIERRYQTGKDIERRYRSYSELLGMPEN